MSSELQAYKENRINSFITIFNANVTRLKSNLVNNVRNIQRSRLRNTQALINAVINKYNNDVNILRNNLNLAIQRINSFTSEFRVDRNNVRSKKALLIGINYIDTPYQLTGCINDTTRMKGLLS